MKTPMKTPILLLPITLMLAACGGGSPETTSPEPAPVDPAVEAVFTDAPPAGEAEPIPQVKTQGKAGKEVILEGRVMGVMNPFVDNRAVFVLGDNATITPCSDMEEDHCPTPWDACCDPNEIRQAGTATVQIVNAEGDVLKQGLEGVNGLEKLATVRVAGTLAPNTSPESLIVNASAIHVAAP